MAFPDSAHAHFLDEQTIQTFGSFLAGVSHPVLGPDHFMAMFSVGLVSAVMGGRHFWQVPICFVAIMPIGWLMGRASLPVLPVELGIALSVVALGSSALFWKRVPTRTIYAAIVIFALFHGYAHGRETPNGIDLYQYAAGFMVGTAGLHVLGLFVGDILHDPDGSDSLLNIVSTAVTLGGVYYLSIAIVNLSRII
jgi:urease accessory protein